MKQQEIMSFVSGFHESRVFLTAAELDVFTLLDKNPMTAGEIANSLEATVRGITILLNAVVSMGLLEKREGKYYCLDEVSNVLSANSKTSMLPMIMWSARGWKRWSNLTDIVRYGKDDLSSPYDFEENEMEIFIGAMHARARILAPGIAAAVKPVKNKKLLDIGGGSGAYTQAFLKESPALKATIFDLPGILEIARTNMNAEGLTGRINFVAGDFYKDELPAGHDLALLSAIIHQNSPEQNLKLYRKIYQVLEPGGRLIIRDHIMNEDHTQPVGGAFFAVNMLVVTKGGNTYSFEEIRIDMEVAGFTGIRLIQTGEKMDGLVEGYKP